MWNSHANRFDLARLRLKQFAHPFDTAPLGIHQEERLAVRAAQHAREAGSVVDDSVPHLAALAHAQELRLTARNACAPDLARCMDADAVPSPLCPYSPSVQLRLACYVTRRA